MTGEGLSRPVSRLLLVLAVLIAYGCAHSRSPASSSTFAGARYVALGSSFAAGPGLLPYRSDAPRCTRSEVNYASLLAKRLGMKLVDQSCGGATTEHVLHGWGELPPQMEAVSRDTRLVTITIGGNDLGYVRGLVGSSCRAGVAVRAESCWPTQSPSARDYAHLEGNLLAIAREVRERAPLARLVFVPYIVLLPRKSCPTAWFLKDDARISREVARRLTDITRKVAGETSSDFLPLERISRGHTPCSLQPWSVGMYPGYDGIRGAAWHPNAEGMRAIADALERHLQH